MKEIINKFIHYYFLNVRKSLYKKLYKYTDINYVNSNITVLNEEYKNVFWMMWLQGIENAPKIVQKCINSIKFFHPDKEIIILTNDNIEQYINIPDIIKKKYNQGIISNAHYSDYIRICILAKYGGLWIDSTVLLTGKIPDIIFEQEFFIYKSKFWHCLNKVPSLNIFFSQFDIDLCCGSNWFIYSKPHNYIVENMKIILENYWEQENKVVSYFFFHYLMTFLIIRNEKCRNIINGMYSVPNNIPHLLYKMRYCKFNKDLFEEIQSITPIHKLTYKFDKIPKGSFAEYFIEEYNNG